MRDLDEHLREVQRLAALEASGLLDSPPEASFDRLVRLAARFLQAPSALVSLVAADRQFFKASVGLSEELTRKRETSLDQSLCRRVVESGHPLILSDLRDDPTCASPAVVSYLGVPLETTEGHILGSFCVFDSRPRNWSEIDVATMIDLAASVGTEIELRMDISRRAKLERELSEAKGRFEAYMQNSPALAFAKDKHGRLTYMNARFNQHFAESSSWLGKTDHDIWPVDLAEQFKANDQKIWADGVPAEFVEEVLTQDGRRIRFLTLKFPFETPDGEMMLGGMAVDVSDLMETQEALRRSEAESRTLAMVVARIDGAVAIADADCRLEWVSEAYARVLGETPETVIGQDLIRRSMSSVSDLDDEETLWERLLAGERVEFSKVRHDARGRKAWLELEVQAVRGNRNTPDQFIAIARDVTERRRAEGRIAASRACDTILFDSTTLEEAIPRLLQRIGDALDMNNATYWRVDAELNLLLPWSRWGSTPRVDPDGRTLAQGEELAHRIWLERRSITSDDLESAPVGSDRQETSVDPEQTD